MKHKPHTFLFYKTKYLICLAIFGLMQNCLTLALYNYAHFLKFIKNKLNDTHNHFQAQAGNWGFGYKSNTNNQPGDSQQNVLLDQQDSFGLGEYQFKLVDKSEHSVAMFYMSHKLSHPIINSNLVRISQMLHIIKINGVTDMLEC